MAFYAAPDLCLEKKYFGKWSNTTLKDEKRKNKKQQKIGKDEGNFFFLSLSYFKCMSCIKNEMWSRAGTKWLTDDAGKGILLDIGTVLKIDQET